MKRTAIIAVSLVFIMMGGISAASADQLANTMFTAQEKAYLSKVDKGVDFTPVKTETTKPEKVYVNTMLTQTEQAYLQAVSNGVDFTPKKTTSLKKQQSGLVNTMFSGMDVDKINSINL
ncbi:MAG: hypothetical protein SWH68_13190 [Thermodesulfobacteriota bacterium]|nr:hypothetical protein [Thermodesulfobacteriota bacterium]